MLSFAFSSCKKWEAMRFRRSMASSKSNNQEEDLSPAGLFSAKRCACSKQDTPKCLWPTGRSNDDMPRKPCSKPQTTKKRGPRVAGAFPVVLYKTLRFHAFALRSSYAEHRCIDRHCVEACRHWWRAPLLRSFRPRNTKSPLQHCVN